MTLRANSNAKFLLRFLLIAAVCFGYVIWGAYDALIKGPKELKKANAYWVQGTDENGDSVWQKRFSEESGEWTEMVKKNNWALGEPKTPSSAMGFLYFNYALVALCLVGGTIAASKFLKTNNTWIEYEEGSLKTSWGENFQVDSIHRIDKKKWDNKGVARIEYQTQGATKTFVLDDFKYHREETDTILYHIEEQLSDNQIINGDREPSPEAREKARLDAEAKRRELDVVENDES